MTLGEALKKAKPYLLEPLLPALQKNRLAFSRIDGWRVRATSPEEVRQALESLLEEELLPFVVDACHGAPSPYGESGFVAFLSICTDEDPTPLAKGTVAFQLLELEEGKRKIGDFYLDHLPGVEEFIVMAEVFSWGRYYDWLLGTASSGKKSIPESFIRQ